ncbi:MAG: hypothetical protein ACRD59_17250 [Candidatus Acidiferrales bacterium]
MSHPIIERSRRTKNERFTGCLLATLAAAFLLVPAGRAGERAGVSVQAGPQDAAAATPKLAGQWQLNKDQSDDPREKMQAARGESGGGGRGQGQGGRNGGGRGQGGGMMDEMSALQIEQTGLNVKVSGKSGRVLAQIPAAAESGENPGSAEGEGGGRGRRARATTAQWQNGALVAVTQSPRGKSTRTYSLSPDGKQLYVTTKMESERLSQPVTYRRVYDAAAGKSGGN